MLFSKPCSLHRILQSCCKEYSSDDVPGTGRSLFVRVSVTENLVSTYPFIYCSVSFFLHFCLFLFKACNFYHIRLTTDIPSLSYLLLMVFPATLKSCLQFHILEFFFMHHLNCHPSCLTLSLGILGFLGHPLFFDSITYAI